MTRITPQHRAAMLAAIAHLVNAEWAALTDDLEALDVLKPSNDRGEVARALAAAFAGGAQPLITGTGVPRVRFGQVRDREQRLGVAQDMNRRVGKSLNLLLEAQLWNRGFQKNTPF